MAAAFLGLNILHDTSAAIVVDGELVCAIEEERFNRDRHTNAFPVAAIEYCLEQAGIRRADLRGVGLTFDYGQFKGNDNPFDKNLIDHDDLGPAGRELIAAQNLATWREARNQLERNGLPDARYFRHHLTHAACGYYLSGFDEASVLVIDGRGERESTSLWHASGVGIDHLESYPVSDSIGHLYTYVTSLCGLYGKSGLRGKSDVPDHVAYVGNEGKTMGLAGYGSGKLSFDDVLTFDADRYHIHLDKLRNLDIYRVPLGQPDANSRELAYWVQQKLEEAYHFLAARLAARTGCRQFVLAGGVALNCNANAALATSSIADELFVPPAAHDAGAAIGAASLQWVEFSGKAPTVPVDQIYLGPSVDEDSVADAIANSGVSRVAKVADPAGVAAAAIADGLVVGWCQGRMEFGPRALGNRSILADPRDTNIPKKLNTLVKFREPWRPFAPSVLAEQTAEWFEEAMDSPYMLLSMNVRSDRRSSVPAITHVDGSARVQTVTEAANPLYYRLIDCFRNITGVPMVLNTSLNIRGEPIARTPADAVRCFTESGLDVLVVADMVMWKDDVRVDLEGLGAGHIRAHEV
ncbi:beta-1,4-N-acetylglucosamine oligosaccharide 3-O-carbamoyltransferase NolO [Nocardia tenerifensis]|uniref:Beta-1,4-N-acetylglucosamine oligosaccharide 3-O-carbamoyltransferase NolO n=1 Tax=Nocardia tenerifensis TaxID=228006 RepID=A0A318KNA6_9NOCA|nr:carbamoyltransferase C-terminal domain-containing protein [Nocardia tenerifensis]PXX63915.1 beta-1,4-N-acetylglucosamine oligosaccharide 3-O-carbamoyltransferase NolO [Nocardia tenerifensis]